MLVAAHFAHNLLLLLHPEDHVTRLYGNRGLRLMRLQRCKVRVAGVHLISGDAGNTLLLHAIDILEALVDVAAANHLIEGEALARNLLLYQSVCLRRRRR